MHTLASAASAAPEFAAVYRDHHGFVWRTLRHLGVDPGRVDDALQDTFMVVHARLAEFEGRAALRTWLFEIARRVAGRYRRTAAREAPRLCVLDEVAGPAQLDDSVERAEAAEILQTFLDELDRDKSVVFIMAELEQWRVPEIAEALELNLNTVYARLRAARKQLDRVVARLQARERRTQPRRGADIVAAAVLAVPPPGSPLWPLGLGTVGPADAALATVDVAIGAPAVTAVGVTKLGVFVTGIVGLTLAAVVSLLDAAPAPAGPPEPSQALEARATRPAPTTPAPTPALRPAATPVVTPTTSEQDPGRALPPRADRFADELALLEQARAALVADDARKTLRLLGRHARRFPAGALTQEAAATRIEALCQLGDDAGAQREAAMYAGRWPATAAWTGAPCGPARRVGVEGREN